jgi:hypothetical protein
LSSFVWFFDDVWLSLSSIGGTAYWNWCSALESFSNAEFNWLISIKKITNFYSIIEIQNSYNFVHFHVDHHQYVDELIALDYV